MAAVAKLIKAAQWALQLTRVVLSRGFREGRQTCLCYLSSSALPSCTLQDDVSVIWVLTRPYRWQFSWYSDRIFPLLPVCFLPYQTLMTPSACSYNLLGLRTGCWVSRIRKDQKPNQRPLLKHQLVQNLCAICTMHCKHWGKRVSGLHFSPILPSEERTFWQLCKHNTPLAKMRPDTELIWKPMECA